MNKFLIKKKTNIKILSTFKFLLTLNSILVLGFFLKGGGGGSNNKIITCDW